MVSNIYVIRSFKWEFANIEMALHELERRTDGSSRPVNVKYIILDFSWSRGDSCIPEYFENWKDDKLVSPRSLYNLFKDTLNLFSTVLLLNL